MKGYLVTFGVATIAISFIAGALYLTSSYDEYQSRLHALGVGPDASIMMYDVVKWQFAKILGGGIISGGWAGLGRHSKRSARPWEMSLRSPLPRRSPGFPRIQPPEVARLACLQLGHTQRACVRGQSHRPAPISKSPTREKVRAVPNQIREMIQKESYFLCRSSSRFLPHR